MRAYTLWFLMLFSIGFSNLVANSKTDSVSMQSSSWQQIPAQDNIEALKELIGYANVASNWDMDIQKAFYKKVFEAAIIHRNDTLIFDYALLIGNHYTDQDSTAQAFYYFNIALDNAYNEGIKYTAYNDLGLLHFHINDYNKALDYFFKSIEAAKMLKDDYETYPLGNVSEVYVALGDFDNAIRYTQLALPFSYQFHFPNREYNLTYDYARLVNFYHQKGNLDAAAMYVDSTLIAINAIDTIQDEDLQIACVEGYLTLAEFYLAQNQLEIAQDYLNEAKEIQGTILYASISFLQAKLFFKQKEYAKTVLWLEKLELEQQEFSLVEKVLLFKIEFYTTLNLPQQVIETQQNLLRIQKKKFGADRLRYSTFANAAYQSLEKENENQLLRNTANRQRFVVISISIIGFFLFLGVLYSRRQQHISEKKELIIRQQKNELEASYNYRNDLFANITHELQTPLTLIEGQLQQSLQTSKNNQRFIPKLTHHINNLKQVTTQILDLTKREQEQALSIVPTRFNLYDLIEALKVEFTNIANYRNITFTTPIIIEAKDFILETDGEKLMTVLRNLLSNAFKFTNNNGFITLSVVDMNTSMTISVQDNGQGILEKDLPLIFNRFFKTTNTAAANAGGMGIGLAICKEYIELLGGTLSVQSKTGQGTAFTIKLPKQLQDTTINAEESQRFNIALQDKINDTTLRATIPSSTKINSEETDLILVVEDNIDMCLHINELLDASYSLVFADNGLKALELLQNIQPSLIISDVMMPQMDGFQFVEQLKKHPVWRDIPVLILTAKSTIADKRLAFRMGVDDYLTKPFAKAELKAHINLLLHNYIERLDFKTQKASALVAANSASEGGNTIITKIDTAPILEERHTSLEDLETLKKLDSIIVENMKYNNFNVEQLADLMAMSYSSLFRLTKRLIGFTPAEYIRELRLQEARKLLESGQYQTVKSILYSLGFKDPRHFSKLFKRRFGKTPSAMLNK